MQYAVTFKAATIYYNVCKTSICWTCLSSSVHEIFARRSLTKQNHISCTRQYLGSYLKVRSWWTWLHSDCEDQALCALCARSHCHLLRRVKLQVCSSAYIQVNIALYCDERAIRCRNVSSADIVSADFMSRHAFVGKWLIIWSGAFSMNPFYSQSIIHSVHAVAYILRSVHPH